MCIAIVKKKDASISDEALKNSFNNNPDGAGIAYAKDGNLYYIKGIFNVDSFIKAVRDAEKEAQGDMLIHCRIGTSGLKDKENCHPHIVNDSTVMIHNGILDINVPKDSKVSDTVIFCQEILSKLPKNFMKNEGIINLIAQAIGSNNKFAFLNNKGESVIVNEEAGMWVDNVWYSNNTYTYNKNLFYDNRSWEWDDEPVYDISKNKIKKLRKKIRNLTDEELVFLGEYPVYDVTNEKLISEWEVPVGEWMYLEEVSIDAYWDYLEQLERRGINVA